MRPVLGSERLGATVGDMLVFLAALSIAGSLLYPAWSVRDFQSRVEAVIADVDAVGTAARGVRDNTSRWPSPSSEGEVPPELASLGDIFTREAYSVRWTPWDVVDSMEAPAPTALPSADDAPQRDAPPTMLPVVRTVGAVVVHTAEQDLLAELLEHYSERPSFVLDTMWILILPERTEPPAPGFGR